MALLPFFLAVLAASLTWFLVAGILFFNPIVDKIYNKQAGHPAVKQLPKSPKTIGKILLAIVIQIVLWALVYILISPVLPGDQLTRGLWFGGILVLTKIIPRDIDRILLTTYPLKRMFIEFVIGAICSFVVGITFGFLL